MKPTPVEKKIPTRMGRAKKAARASLGYDPNVRLEREIPKCNSIKNQGMPPKKKPKKPKKPMSRIGQFYSNFCLSELQQSEPPPAIKAGGTVFKICIFVCIAIAAIYMAGLFLYGVGSLLYSADKSIRCWKDDDTYKNTLATSRTMLLLAAA